MTKSVPKVIHFVKKKYLFGLIVFSHAIIDRLPLIDAGVTPRKYKSKLYIKFFKYEYSFVSRSPTMGILTINRKEY